MVPIPTTVHYSMMLHNVHQHPLSTIDQEMMQLQIRISKEREKEEGLCVRGW